MRILVAGGAATLLARRAAVVQTAPAPNEAAPPRGTDAPSGTARMVAMPDLAQSADRFTGAQARARIAGAGLAKVTGLARDGGGIRRGDAERDGRTVDVGFDYKGQVAFQ